MNEQKGLLESPRVAQFAVVLFGILIAFVAVQMLATLRGFDAPASGVQNVITVSGEGKVSAAPDIASIYFTVSENASTAAAAQDAESAKINAALAVLKQEGIADKDVQTSSYNVYPRYANPEPCYYNGSGVVPPCYGASSEQKIIGYTASQSVTVTVRDVKAVGSVVTALGGAGVSNINGPSFTIDKPDALQAEARAEAIKDARAKADELAKELGVRIVRVASYSEGGYGYPAPMYMKAEAAGTSASDARATPDVPTGENDITVNVTVTYEIR